MKRMTAEEATAWPHKNVIVRALGMKDSVQVDVHTEQPHLGDCFLLCSDGLSGMISDDQIRRLLQAEGDLDRVAERLITAANEAGGKDNITVVLARIEPS
jgi:serine/threonine protein phosphatase PrpC